MQTRPIKWKVCGMRDAENLRALAKLAPDYVGLIFYGKSPRFVEAIDRATLDALPEKTIRTGVFVGASPEQIISKIDAFGISLLQLHGKESPEDCEKLRSALYHAQYSHVKISKAFSVDKAFDFEKCAPYLPHCDFFLFDTKGKHYGGNGVAFDWEVLNRYAFDKPFFLSGGIGPEDANRILQQTPWPNMHAIDINSKFEIRPAFKDVEKIAAFIGKIHQN